MKQKFRAALQCGRISVRILPEPFVYLDKNYLRLFGSIPAALRDPSRLPDRIPVVQVRGETAPIDLELSRPPS